MHGMQMVAVVVMCALEFEYPLALGLGNSDSSSTLAQVVMQTHVCAQNFGHHYRLKANEVVCFQVPKVSGLHVLSCLVHEILCCVPNIFDLAISTVSIELP
jgi:hypothetical protein